LLQDQRRFSLRSVWGAAYVVGVVGVLVVPRGLAVRLVTAIVFVLIFFAVHSRFKKKVPDRERYAIRKS
jgi:predicted PurR-regulated permease PerM